MTLDRSARGIVVANVANVVLALWQDWPLVVMLWPYWCQSVIIGWYARKRILTLQHFSVEGVTLNGRPALATMVTARRAGNFFAMHYGGFHLLYLLFLMVFTAATLVMQFAPSWIELPPDELVSVGTLHWYDPLLVVALAIGFWFSHRASHREHLAGDLAFHPSLARLMLMPYVRVVPMQLTLILAMPFSGAWAIVLFGTLKTVADVVMHRFEHRQLRRTTSANAKSAATIQ